MKLILIFLIGFLTISPMGCSLNPFKSTPDEERFTYDAKGQEVKGRTASSPETPEGALKGPERPEEALTSPKVKEKTTVAETAKEAPAVTPGGEAVIPREAAAAEEVPSFTIIYYARGPKGRAKGAPSDKSKSSLYEKAKEIHIAHNLEKGPYAAYYQEIRNRVKAHWNFLYSDVEGINYKTVDNRPIIIDAKVYSTGLISDVNITNAAGNPVLAALLKSTVETSLVNRFPPEIKAPFIKLSLQWYFED